MITKKENWVAKFTLIGKPIVEDYTFKMNEKGGDKDGEHWAYNALNLRVNCGEKHGKVYAELSGGYFEQSDGTVKDGRNILYAHGKNEDGTENWDERIEVAWEDRLNEDILDSIGDSSFIQVGLQRTDKDKLFVKKFLSGYDAIEYIKSVFTEQGTDNMVINVKGDIKYNYYNEKLSAKKIIKSIMLSRVENESDFTAKCTQSILIDKNSASLSNIDKEKGVMFINAKVLEYKKDIKGQYPYDKEFEFKMDFDNEDKCDLIMKKIFSAPKGYTQINFEGEFIEGGATVTATYDDLPDDIKDLILAEVFTLEEALKKCSAGGSREQRIVLTKPVIKLVGDEEKVPVVQRFENRYSTEDLYDGVNEVNNKETKVETKAETGDTKSESMDWLNSL